MDAIEVLLNRVSPAQLVDPGPTPDQLDKILAAAERAPDHGRMTPWRFVLIEGAARARFGDILARSLKRREPGTSDAQLDIERKKTQRAPLIIIVAAVARENPKVPAVEQIIAAGAAAQNILLAAHALGLGAFWRTGAPAYDAELKKDLGLNETDSIVGFLYIGSIGAPGKLRPGDPAAAAGRRQKLA